MVAGKLSAVAAAFWLFTWFGSIANDPQPKRAAGLAIVRPVAEVAESAVPESAVAQTGRLVAGNDKV